jgi:hypothetical protein
MILVASFHASGFDTSFEWPAIANPLFPQTGPSFSQILEKSTWTVPAGLTLNQVFWLLLKHPGCMFGHELTDVQTLPNGTVASLHTASFEMER